MMETDILICVLISLEEYGSLQGQNLVASDQKSLKSKNAIFVFLHFMINFNAVFRMKKALCPYLLWKPVFESLMSM